MFWMTARIFPLFSARKLTKVVDVWYKYVEHGCWRQVSKKQLRE